MSYDFFESTQDIERYIERGDKDSLRAILIGIINRDPTFATKRYEEALDYISSKCLDLWDEWKNVAGEYKLPEKQWNKEYFRMQLAWLSQNFNTERVSYIQKVGERVYAAEHTWGKEEKRAKEQGLGKEESENFHHPIPQREKNAAQRQGVIGRIALLIVIIVIAVMLFLRQGARTERPAEGTAPPTERKECLAEGTVIPTAGKDVIVMT